MQIKNKVKQLLAVCKIQCYLTSEGASESISDHQHINTINFNLDQYVHKKICIKMGSAIRHSFLLIGSISKNGTYDFSHSFLVARVKGRHC